jgi:hypothetical protein
MSDALDWVETNDQAGRDAFLIALKVEASQCHPDALSYATLGVESAVLMPLAALALVNAALVVEVNSLIDAFVGRYNINGSTRRLLSNRSLATRLKGIHGRLGDRALMPADDLDRFLACCQMCAGEGNKALHPADGPGETEPHTVRAVLNAFMELAVTSTGFKIKLERPNPGSVFRVVDTRKQR